MVFPVVHQVEEMDCGPAALTMVARYHGCPISLHDVKERTSCGREGTSLYQLAFAATSLGFVPRAVRTGLDGLAAGPLPGIAHWEDFHFLVVRRVGRLGVDCVDPSGGPRWLSRKRFLRGWGGLFLFLEPGPDFQRDPVPSAAPDSAVAARWTRDHAARILRGKLARVADLLLVPGAAVLGGLRMGLAGAGAVAALAVLARALAAREDRTVRRALEERVDGRFLHKLHLLPVEYFTRRGRGDLVGHYLARGDLVAGLLASPAVEAAGLLASIGAAAAIDPLGGAAVAAGSSLALATRSRGAAGRSPWSALHRVLLEATGAWTDLSPRLRAALRRQIEEAAGPAGATGASTLAASPVLLGAAAALGRAASDGVDGPRLAASVLAAVLAGASCRGFTRALRERAGLPRALEHLRELDAARSEESLLTAAPYRLSPSLHGHVVFEGVWDRPSRNRPWVLRGVDLDLSPGSTLVVVGGSLSGKTSLLALLLKLREPERGRILIDGVDLSRVSPSSLRRRVALVPSDEILLGGSVLDNLAVEPPAEYGRIRDAARATGLEGVVMARPEGYERPADLSSVERRLVALTRALAARPSVLLVDDLDGFGGPDEVLRLRRAIRASCPSATAVFTCRRLELADPSDRIVRLAGGRIEVDGPPGSHATTLGRQEVPLRVRSIDPGAADGPR